MKTSKKPMYLKNEPCTYKLIYTGSKRKKIVYKYFFFPSHKNSVINLPYFYM